MQYKVSINYLMTSRSSRDHRDNEIEIFGSGPLPASNILQLIREIRLLSVGASCSLNADGDSQKANYVWYEMDSDMKAISEKYPEHYFVVECYDGKFFSAIVYNNGKVLDTYTSSISYYNGYIFK